MEFNTTLEALFIVSYVLCCMGLNVVAFLISAFYRKKIGANAPYLGFMLSLLMGAIFIGTILVKGSEVYMGIVRTTALLGFSISSTLSVLGLFLSMRRTKN